MTGQFHIRLLAALLVFAALFGLAGNAMATTTRGTELVAKKAFDPKLGKTVLTDTESRTLYGLSAEKHGGFICTGACQEAWHPLVIPAGVKPRGPVALGTRARPDGHIQVTFNGLPLYTFAGDKAPGEANGEGIRDVGTWHAIVVAGHGE